MSDAQIDTAADQKVESRESKVESRKSRVESRKPMSEAKKAANKRWNDANLKERYDRVQLVLPKGGKQLIQDHASQFDKSLNAFVMRAITEQMKRDTEKSI